jgi:hypothetical protein
VLNIVSGTVYTAKEVEEPTPVVEEVVNVPPPPTYLKFSYNDSVVIKLLNSTTDDREKYTLEAIRDRNGYGKMGYYKKYDRDGITFPTQEEFTVMEDRLEKLRLEGLNGLSQPALDFATFEAKCNSLISAEYQRDPRYKRTREAEYATGNYTTLDYSTLRDQSDLSVGYTQPVESKEELLSASTPTLATDPLPTTDSLDQKFKTD